MAGPRKVYTDADLTPFGRRLKEAFESAGYTQTSFERAAGLGKGALGKLLYNPNIQGISFDNIEKVEALTGVRIQWLVFGELPKFDGEPQTPEKKAAALARRDGIAEDVISHVRRRNAGAAWDTEGWYRKFREANRQAIDDEEYRGQLRRVALEKRISDAATNQPPPPTATTTSRETTRRKRADR